jgi:hypothetical protein
MLQCVITELSSREDYLGNRNILVPRGKERFYLIPSVAASESGGAQTTFGWGLDRVMRLQYSIRKVWEGLPQKVRAL